MSRIPGRPLQCTWYLLYLPATSCDLDLLPVPIYHIRDAYFRREVNSEPRFVPFSSHRRGGVVCARGVFCLSFRCCTRCTQQPLRFGCSRVGSISGVPSKSSGMTLASFNDVIHGLLPSFRRCVIGCTCYHATGPRCWR